MSRAWAAGSTWAWRRLRLQILARDGYQCTIGLPGCKVRADCVHHTKGRAVTGDDPRYLAAACSHCNARIGDPSKHADPAPQPLTLW